jgi:phenylalanine-4-hydroxylase
MPLSRSIRSPEEVFFGREPDLLHDLFGHLPSLMNGDYRRLLSQWAHVASRQPVTETDRAHYHLNKIIVQSHDRVPDGLFAHLTVASERLTQFVASRPTRCAIFDKLYFWIFEFGVIENSGRREILGAGLLSSLSEVQNFALGNTRIKRLSVDTILSPYNISSCQNEYFAAFDVSHYRDIISAVIKTFAPRRNSEVVHHAVV